MPGMLLPTILWRYHGQCLSRTVPPEIVEQYLSRTVPLGIVEQYRRVYGMVQPLLKQYANFVVAIIHGDWGNSPEYGLPFFSFT